MNKRDSKQVKALIDDFKGKLKKDPAAANGVADFFVHHLASEFSSDIKALAEALVEFEAAWHPEKAAASAQE